MKTLKRRRLEAKTDYKARLALLKSKKMRLIIRKTNRYIIAQFVQTDIAQDKVIIGISSKILLSKGWPEESKGSLKSLHAAYLTGLTLGKMGKGKVKEAILDMGMHRNVKNSRVFAALKGVIDSGILIPHDSESLLSLENLKKNEKLFKIMEKVKA